MQLRKCTECMNQLNNNTLQLVYFLSVYRTNGYGLKVQSSPELRYCRDSFGVVLALTATSLHPCIIKQLHSMTLESVKWNTEMINLYLNHVHDCITAPICVYHCFMPAWYSYYMLALASLSNPFIAWCTSSFNVICNQGLMCYSACTSCLYCSSCLIFIQVS